MDIDKNENKIEVFNWPVDKKKIIEYYKITDNISCMEYVKNMILGPINSDYVSAAEKIVKEGLYSLPHYGIYDYKRGIDWSKNQTTTRSFMRILHGHFFITDLVYAYKKTKNLGCIKKAMK